MTFSDALKAIKDGKKPKGQDGMAKHNTLSLQHAFHIKIQMVM